MEVTLKKAVVFGCGSIGSKYIDLLSELGFSVGCYDVKKIDSELIKDKVTFYDTAESCIDSKPDIIIISTPPDSHLSCLEIAIKSKAKILLEKPLAASKEEAQNILKIYQNNKGRIWCVANMRYHNGFQTLDKNIKNLGKIYSATSYFSHRLSQMRSKTKNLYAAKKNEGGVILDCVHDIDLLYKLFGKLLFVNSWIATLGNEKIEAEDYAHLWLKSENGIHISMQLDFLSRWKSRGIKIIGENGTLVWESNGRKPELATVKFYGTDRVIKTYLDDSPVSSDLEYKEMLIDFISECKNLQTVEEALEILNLSLMARV